MLPAVRTTRYTKHTKFMRDQPGSKMQFRVFRLFSGFLHFGCDCRPRSFCRVRRGGRRSDDDAAGQFATRRKVTMKISSRGGVEAQKLSTSATTASTADRA